MLLSTRSLCGSGAKDTQMSGMGDCLIPLGELVLCKGHPGGLLDKDFLSSILLGCWAWSVGPCLC